MHLLGGGNRTQGKEQNLFRYFKTKLNCITSCHSIGCDLIKEESNSSKHPETFSVA